MDNTSANGGSGGIIAWNSADETRFINPVTTSTRKYYTIDGNGGTVKAVVIEKGTQFTALRIERCPYCRSKWTEDRRGNCLSCGGTAD